MASIYDELTPTWLKNNFLVGVDLTLDDGSDYPEELYTNCIRSSVFHLEHELGIKIDQVTVTKERHDGIEMLRSGFFPFRLDKRPVHSISKANIQYGSYEPVELPLAWIQRVSDIHGQVHLIPSKDQLGSYSFHAGIPLIMGDILQPLDYIPGYFDFSYVAGFGHETGTVSISAGSTTSTVSFSSDFMDAEYTVTPTVTVSGSGGAQTLTASVSNKTDSGFTLRFAPSNWFDVGYVADGYGGRSHCGCRYREHFDFDGRFEQLGKHNFERHKCGSGSKNFKLLQAFKEYAPSIASKIQSYKYSGGVKWL